jgi:hypothetical protein
VNISAAWAGSPSIFLTGDDGRRPTTGSAECFQSDRYWCDLVLFHEYFHR